MFNPDTPFVFGPGFFKQHQEKLLKLANSWVGRRILCLKKSSVGKNKVTKITPTMQAIESIEGDKIT